jgi:demethylmenaquinone methyltransferase/2-methoxy-6-polyprenyl-1,4-benzoquinol methylase
MKKLYPDSKVELNPFISRFYNTIIQLATFKKYYKYIDTAIDQMNIHPDDKILDLGCGTGKNACSMHQYLGSQGEITGMDISQNMEKQFKKRCNNLDNVSFLKQRIDKQFDLKESYDKIFISFVIHGFPQRVRETIIENAFRHLTSKGSLHIMDFGHFHLKDMPFYYRIPFKIIECKYAFDFIEKDWESILRQKGFKHFRHYKFFKGYLRHLAAHKS